MLCSGPFNPPQFVAAGDSHVYGNDDPSHAWTVYLAVLLQNYTIINTGHNGIGWSEVSSFYASEALPHARSSTGIPSFYWIDVGTNNIQIGDSGASLYAGVAPILARAKANGSFVGATQVWTAPSWNAGQITQVQAYNALLLTDPSCDMLFNGFATFPDPNGPYFNGSGHLIPSGQSTYAQGVFAAMLAAKKI